MLRFYQGETAKFEITVMDATGPANLTGVTGAFAYRVGTTIITKPCTITGNVVTVELPPEETADLYGDYAFEIKIQDLNLDVDTVVRDDFRVMNSLFPDFPA